MISLSRSLLNNTWKDLEAGKGRRKEEEGEQAGTRDIPYALFKTHRHDVTLHIALWHVLLAWQHGMTQKQQHARRRVRAWRQAFGWHGVAAGVGGGTHMHTWHGRQAGRLAYLISTIISSLHLFGSRLAVRRQKTSIFYPSSSSQLALFLLAAPAFPSLAFSSLLPFLLLLSCSTSALLFALLPCSHVCSSPFPSLSPLSSQSGISLLSLLGLLVVVVVVVGDPWAGGQLDLPHPVSL